MTRLFACLIFACCYCFAEVSFSQEALGNKPALKTITIMPVGDSITEGSDAFVVYRSSLFQKLQSAGYSVTFVGSRKRGSFRGDALTLNHEAYSGQNVSQITAKFEALYQQNPADILLIHAGHNQFADQKPVPKMLEDTRSMIKMAQKINPRVTVLLAQVIPSGKLPKYAYIPELNGKLIPLAAKLNSPEHPVVIVNQAEGFNWETDTISDHVHPNKNGAEKMAARWFESLQKVLPNPQ